MNWIWIGVIILLLLIEFVSLNFTSIWFVFSSIISFILLKMGKDYIAQVSVFLIIGIFLIVVIRPKIINKLFIVRDNVIDKITKKHPFLIHLVPHELRNNKKIDKKTKVKK